MSDRFEPTASSASDSASNDDVTRQREHFTADTALGAGSTSDLPVEEQASAALTKPRRARLTRRLGGDERTSRRSRWIGRVGAFMVTALVVTLISYLLVDLAPARSKLGDSPTGTPPLTALATATTATTATTARPQQGRPMPASRRLERARTCIQRLDLPSNPSRPHLSICRQILALKG